MSEHQIYTTLRAANVARQAAWGLGKPQLDLAFAGVELAGEAGEVCNVIKKLERERLGWKGSTDTVEHLAEEIADTAICLDLIAMRFNIDSDTAIAAKFNATSEKIGLPHRLAAPTPAATPSGPAAVALEEVEPDALADPADAYDAGYHEGEAYGRKEAKAEIERLTELADKFKWQVIDTCKRAEKAEAALASPQDHGAVRDALTKLDRFLQHRPSCTLTRALPFEIRSGGLKCSCGLDDAREALKTNIDKPGRKGEGLEPFPRPRWNPDKEPCGECHIQPGETCDICGASHTEVTRELVRQKSCSRCMFWLPTGIDNQGECRRHAPSSQPVVEYLASRTVCLGSKGHVDPDVLPKSPQWPETTDDEWCGEFRAADVVVQDSKPGHKP